MTESRPMTADGWMILACAAVTFAMFTGAIPAHVADPTWPDHARNHVLQALFWIDGFCVLQAIIACTAYRAGQGWAWWALLVAGFATYGGYFIPIIITRGGAPGALDDVVFAVLAAVYAVALALGHWRTRMGDTGP